jgi:hypothetical protein
VLEYCLGNALRFALMNLETVNADIAETLTKKPVMQIVVFACDQALVESS